MPMKCNPEVREIARKNLVASEIREEIQAKNKKNYFSFK